MDYKKELLATARIMEDKGFLTALEGNISVLDRETGRLYISPTGQRKQTMTEDMVAVMDINTDEQIEGTWKVSTEYLLHKVALLSRPDCNAAIHSHCLYLTAYAFLNKPINMKNTNNIAVLAGTIPCIPYGIPGTLDITNGLAEELQKTNMCLLGNHGVICIDKSLLTCSGLLEMVEKTVQTYELACSLGTPVAIPEEKIELIKQAHNY